MVCLYIYNEKRFMLNNIKTQSYSKLIIDNNYIKTKDILHITLPIDLNVAYPEHLYQS